MNLSSQRVGDRVCGISNMIYTGADGIDDAVHDADGILCNVAQVRPYKSHTIKIKHVMKRKKGHGMMTSW